MTEGATCTTTHKKNGAEVRGILEEVNVDSFIHRGAAAVIKFPLEVEEGEVEEDEGGGKAKLPQEDTSVATQNWQISKKNEKEGRSIFVLGRSFRDHSRGRNYTQRNHTNEQ